MSHGIVAEAQALANANRIRVEEAPNIYGGITSKYAAGDARCEPLDPEAEHILDGVIGVYGKLTLQQLVAASKRTKPFKSARQYELIEMEQTAPALAGAQADWEAHLQEAAKEGFRSLQEINGGPDLIIANIGEAAEAPAVYRP